MRLTGSLTDRAIDDFSSACAAVHAHVRPAYIKDENLRYVAANAAYCALARTSEQKLIRKDSARVTAALYSAYTEEIERQVLDFGKHLTALQIYPDNQRQFRIVLRPVRDGEGASFVMGLFEACDVKQQEDQQLCAAQGQPTQDACLYSKSATSNVFQLPVRDMPPQLSDWQSWQTALDAIDGAIVVWDPDYRIVACNQAFVQKYPLVADWRTGQSLTELVTRVAEAGLAGEAERDPQAWIRVRVAERKAAIDQAFTIVHSHGTCTLWRNATTKTGDRICIATDINDIAGTVTQVPGNKREESDFFSNLNHEIRTPMTGIFGLAEMLARSCDDPKHKNIANIFARSTQAVQTILNDIHDYSSVETGNLILSRQPFNLRGIVNEVTAIMAAPIAEKDIEISVLADDEVPETLVGDAIRIRQVLNNLVSNAVKHTDVGQVRITLECTPCADGHASVTVSVHDAGKGISPEKQKALFDIFALTRKEPSDRHEGSGLGLALCARLIALMGGEFAVESQINKGSTFRFTLSLPIGELADRSHLVAVDLPRPRVLVICADRAVRQKALQMSADLPFDTCVALDVAEGRRVLQANWQLDLATDLVIVCSGSDMHAGLSVVQNVFNDAKHQNPPLILLGSGERHFGADEMKKLGISAFVHSGSGCDNLRATAVSVMGASRKRLMPPDNQNNVASTMSRHEVGPIPAAGLSPAVHASPNEAASNPNGKFLSDGEQPDNRIRVLVAEDNAVNQIVFSQILEQLGLTFQVVGNGVQAITAWKRYRPDIILMDVAMPLMDGFDATQSIRQAEEGSGAHVPIVGVTAYTFMNDHERCLHAGMDDCLCKPVSRGKLQEKLLKYLPDLDFAALADTGRG